MARIFGVDQRQQRQFLSVRLFGPGVAHDGTAGNLHQFALPGQRQGIKAADPAFARFYGHIPDFFLSQSSSILSRPISQ
jgi:hypothetical protein